MRPGEFECGIVVIECGWFPRAGGMATFTVRAKLAIMRIVFLMTGIARRWCAFEHGIYMTRSTLNTGMGAGELESGIIVVERGWFPPVCGVAPFTICAELSIMRVIFLVAIVARRWRAFEHTIHMA